MGFAKRGLFGAESGCVLYADATYTRDYTVVCGGVGAPQDITKMLYGSALDGYISANQRCILHSEVRSRSIIDITGN